MHELEKVTAEAKPAPKWRSVFLKAAGVGAGATATILVFGLASVWYTTRPTPPKPWKTDVITAEYDVVTTEGDKNTLAFYYTLVNNSDTDYKLTDGDPVSLAAKLKRQNSLSINKDVTTEYPVFVPAHGRARLGIHIGSTYPVKEPSVETPDERRKYHTLVARYVAAEYANLDGFVLLDESARYQILFPNGWKDRAKTSDQPGSTREVAFDERAWKNPEITVTCSLGASILPLYSIDGKNEKEVSLDCVMRNTSNKAVSLAAPNSVDALFRLESGKVMQVKHVYLGSDHKEIPAQGEVTHAGLFLGHNDCPATQSNQDCALSGLMTARQLLLTDTASGTRYGITVNK